MNSTLNARLSVAGCAPVSSQNANRPVAAAKRSQTSLFTFSCVGTKVVITPRVSFRKSGVEDTRVAALWSQSSLAGWRNTGRPSGKLNRPERIAPRHAAILVTRPRDQITGEQQTLLDRLTIVCPDIIRLRDLALAFRDALRGHDGAVLQEWINEVMHCDFGPLVRFGYGPQKDFSAVTAAVETKWSSGQVEGQVNRLKAIKRQMYGRAGFNLLRARVLPYPRLGPFTTNAP